MFKNKYRIVVDSFCGFEVQIKRWWLPVWLQVGINTFPTEEGAMQFAKRHANKVVKSLGVLN